jgi:hypothetical protein
MICPRQLTGFSWFPIIISVAYHSDPMAILEGTIAIEGMVPIESSSDTSGFSMASISLWIVEPNVRAVRLAHNVFRARDSLEFTERAHHSTFQSAPMVSGLGQFA